jgi:MFS transporter, DHA1 family, multidrug resistance protein
VVKASLFASIFVFALMTMVESEPGKIAASVMLTSGFFKLANSMIRPDVSSLISKQADTSQGMAMGMNNTFMRLGRIIGPLWAGYTLDINLNYPYLTGAIIMVIGFSARLFFLPKTKEESIPANVQSAD